jgi:hypothetical protein
MINKDFKYYVRQLATALVTLAFIYASLIVVLSLGAGL